MKAYPEAKFSQLKTQRQAQIILDLISRIERDWSREIEPSHFERLSDYLRWFCFIDHKEPTLSHLQALKFRIHSKMSLRDLLDIAVPFERYLQRSLEDSDFLVVQQGDRSEKQTESLPLCFVLDHLRSSFNVGSIFRLADGLGVEHIYLVGYTPTPDDPGVLKTAMGAWQNVSWSHHHHLKDVIDILRKKNHQLVALETATNGKDLGGFKGQSPLTLFVGNERFGLDTSLLNQMDEVVRIPLRGKKNSLNVAQSLAIASFEVSRQWSQS